MVLITIFTICMVYSLPFLKLYTNSSSIRRICAISFLYASILCYNILNFQSIGYGIGIYSGYYQINVLSLIIVLVICLVCSIILIVWPNLDNISNLNNFYNDAPNYKLDEKKKINQIFLFNKYYSFSSYPKGEVDSFIPRSSPSPSPYLNKTESQTYAAAQKEKPVIMHSESAPTLSNSLANRASVLALSTKKLTYNGINNSFRSNEYCLIILFNILGALFLICSSDLVSMFLSIELQSFALYILTTLYKERNSSTSAGLKYFLLGGLSSCIILLGSGIIYTYSGLTNLESIYSLIAIYFNNLNYGGPEAISTFSNIIMVLNNDLIGLSLGLLLIFSGFLFKIAAAPFHNWSPDVYDDSPTLVTTWLTILPKISILVFLLELHIGTDLNLNLFNFFSYNQVNTLTNLSVNVITNLLLLSSLLSLLIGSIVGLSQFRIKRLLAYSTINHIGFLLLSLSVFSNSSIEAFIFYIIQYTITNLNIFLIILALSYIFKVTENNDKNNIVNLNLSDIEYISSLKGLFYKNPLLSISLSICLFSFAGIPPLIGFFAKQQVLYSSNSAGFFFLSFVAIIVSVISASYYLKIIKVLHTISISAQVSLNDYKSIKIYATATHSFIIGLLTLFILLFILNPEILLNCIAIISSFILNLS